MTRSLGRVIDVAFNPAIHDQLVRRPRGPVSVYQQERGQVLGYVSLDSAATGFGPVVLNANLLGTGTASTEQLVGLGITFSTVAAATRHGSRLPFDITSFHFQTLTGSAGTYGSLPRIGSDEILARIYVRLFGHGGAFKR